jgi:hypothetical protein
MQFTNMMSPAVCFVNLVRCTTAALCSSAGAWLWFADTRRQRLDASMAGQQRDVAEGSVPCIVLAGNSHS